MHFFLLLLLENWKVPSISLDTCVLTSLNVNISLVHATLRVVCVCIIPYKSGLKKPEMQLVLYVLCDLWHGFTVYCASHHESSSV